MIDRRFLGAGLFGLGVLILASCDDDQTSSSSVADAPGKMDAKAPQGPPDDDARRYLFKEGMIVYRLDGMRSGTETLYWRDWGRQEARYVDATLAVGGMSQTIKTWTILDDDTMTTIDQQAGQATRMNVADMALTKMGRDDQLRMGEEIVKALGGEPQGTDTIADTQCTLWSIPVTRTELCLWQGMTLRVKTDMGPQSMVMEASAIDVFSPVDSKHFTVPSDITVTDMAPPTLPGMFAPPQGSPR